MGDGSNGIFRQVVIVALPGLGAGAQPDAADYHDRGASTLAHVATYAGGVDLTNLAWLGLGNVVPMRSVAPASPPAASVARAARATSGREVRGGLLELVGGAVRAVAASDVDVHAIGAAAHALIDVPGVEPHELGPREALVDSVVATMRRYPRGVLVACPEEGRGLTGSGPIGLARALSRFDASLSMLLDQLAEETLLIIAGLGGSDTTIATGAGPTREYAPVLAYSAAVPSGVQLGTRLTLADVGATAADVFGVAAGAPGRSFLAELLV